MEITRDVAAKVLATVDAGLVSGVGNPVPGQMCVEAAVCFALGLPHGDDPKGCVAESLRSLKLRLNDSNFSSPEVRAKALRRLALAQLGSAGILDEKEFARRVVDYALRVSTPAALRAAASVCKHRDHIAALIAAAARCENEGTREAAIEAKNDAYAYAYAYAYAAAAYAAYAAAYAYAAATTAANYAAYAATADATAATAYAAAAANYAAAAAAYTANEAAAAAYTANAANEAAAAAACDKSLSVYAEAVVQILIDMKAPGCRWLSLTEVPQ